MRAAANNVEKTIDVQVPIEAAFRVWTEQLDLWWPKQGHTRSGRIDSEIRFEPWVGGRLLEVLPDGQELAWGAVLVWDPPHRLTHTWFLGSDEKQPTEVRVLFRSLGPERTRVSIVHVSGQLEPDLWDTRAGGFSRAWDEVITVLDRYLATRS